MNDMDEVAKEVAKATGEVAKASGKAIDASREAGGFLSQFIQGPLEQVSGIVEDQLKYFRWKRRHRLMDRANQFLKDRGLKGPTRTVPLKIAVDIMREGSQEENDELQDRWAQLLVNAADTESGVVVRPMYLGILKDLSPEDAQVLDSIYSMIDPKEIGIVVEGSLNNFTVRLNDPPTIAKIFTAQEKLLAEEMQLTLSNLERLRLISLDRAWSNVTLFGGVQQTLLGREFVRACSHKRET